MQQARDDRRRPVSETPRPPRLLRFDAPHPRPPRPWWWLLRAEDRPQN